MREIDIKELETKELYQYLLEVETLNLMFYYQFYLILLN